MKVKIDIYDVVDERRKTLIASLTLPTTNGESAGTLIEFAEASFSMGIVNMSSDYYAGLRAMFYGLLSAHFIQGLVVVEAKVA